MYVLVGGVGAWYSTVDGYIDGGISISTPYSSLVDVQFADDDEEIYLVTCGEIDVLGGG